MCRQGQKPEVSCATQLYTVSDSRTCSKFTYSQQLPAEHTSHDAEVATSAHSYLQIQVWPLHCGQATGEMNHLEGARPCLQPLWGASDPTTDTGPSPWHSGQHPKFCLHWKHGGQRLSCCLSWFRIQELDLNPGRSMLESLLSHTHSLDLAEFHSCEDSSILTYPL